MYTQYPAIQNTAVLGVEPLITLAISDGLGSFFSWSS